MPDVDAAFTLLRQEALNLRARSASSNTPMPIPGYQVDIDFAAAELKKCPRNVTGWSSVVALDDDPNVTHSKAQALGYLPPQNCNTVFRLSQLLMQYTIPSICNRVTQQSPIIACNVDEPARAERANQRHDERLPERKQMAGDR